MAPGEHRHGGCAARLVCCAASCWLAAASACSASQSAGTLVHDGGSEQSGQDADAEVGAAADADADDTVDSPATDSWSIPADAAEANSVDAADANPVDAADDEGQLDAAGDEALDGGDSDIFSPDALSPLEGMTGYIKFNPADMAATFYPADSGPGWQTYAGTIGPCDTYNYWGQFLTVPPEVSAGTLTFSGGNLMAPVSCPPTFGSLGEITYQCGPPVPDGSTPMALFSSGENLYVSGSGSSVPPFPTHQVVAPSPISLLTPVALDAGSTYSIDASRDLLVTWSGGVAGSRVVVFGEGSNCPNSPICVFDFACEFPSEAGQGVIPQVLLASLFNRQMTTITFDIAHLNRTIFAAGAYTIALSAELDSWGSATLHCSPPLPNLPCPVSDY